MNTNESTEYFWMKKVTNMNESQKLVEWKKARKSFTKEYVPCDSTPFIWNLEQAELCW